ncbi:MAG: hypothetical protein QOF76_5167 [Solirubrobacteraceae bacterium]|nr:hypothetical protein [Solirubrobacteraceae bacterium]
MSGVAVIVPARDAAGTLGATLAALARQTVSCEVVVVDDGSVDGTAAVAASFGVRVIVGRNAAVAIGPGAARNAGAAATASRVLAFTDADCVPEPGWLEAGLAALNDADLVQGRVEPDPAAPRHPFDRTLSVPAAYGLFEAANLFVTREWFDRLGGFGDGIAAPGKHLAEDVYFGWAARRAGARVAFAPGALVHHAVFPRSAREFAAERTRLRHFPEIVRTVPELRERFLYRRLFLNAHTALFDAAVVGSLTALRTKRPLPLLVAAPYAVVVRRRARHWPAEPTARLAAAFVAAVVVGAAALLRGSIEQRSPVL